MKTHRMDRLTCRQAQEKLFDYLDREIGERDRQRVEEHLAMCEACTRRFGFERKLLDQIREKAGRQGLPSDVKRRLAAMLRNI
ncbi:MAG: zf-HC2 domain-containing protein [Armatimonadetes bacterium]|nr:zf-HC2 domain-containing protein [Armatimonadota bacterium]